MKDITPPAGPSNRHLLIVPRSRSFAGRWATLVAVGVAAERLARDPHFGPRDGGGCGAAIPRAINVVELRARCLGVMRAAA